MSHVTDLKLSIQDLQCLARACEELGLEFREGQSRYRWYGRYMGDSPLPQGFTREQLGKCDHAIAVPGNEKAYEVGVVQKTDGTYTLLLDEWMGGHGLVERTGKGCGRLMQEYGCQVAIQQANREGLRYTGRSINPTNQRVRLEFVEVG